MFVFSNDLSASVDTAFRLEHIAGSTDAKDDTTSSKAASVIQLVAYWLSKQAWAVELKLTAQSQFQ